MKIELTTKLKAIEEYQREKNLKNVATRYKIHYATLSRWIKKFNENKILYPRPWNRISPEIEKMVMLLKENTPGITLHQAKKSLMEKGIHISIKGIYDIWNRYGLTRRLVDDPFSFFVQGTPETKICLEYVRYLLKKELSNEVLKKAAGILNSLPGFPSNYDYILEQIPEDLLSLRRKFDKLYNQFLKIPTPEFYKKIHKLRLQFEKENLYYSAIIAGLSEILALHWMRTPEKEIELNHHLKRLKGRLRDPILNFQLTFLEATARTEIMDTAIAKRLTQKARRLLRSLPYASFYESYGDLATFMGDYKTALRYRLRALEMAKEEEEKNRLYFKSALCLTIDGKYREALKYLKLAKIDYKKKYYDSYNLTHTLASFGLGKLEKAEFFIQKTLEKSEKEHFRNAIFTAICCLAAIKMALGNIVESEQLLKEYLPLMKKFNIQRETLIMQFLLEKKIKKLHTLPTVYILHLIKQAKDSLKERDYIKIFEFAAKYGLTGYLHRCLFFVPELILHRIAQGRNVLLPRCLLQLPIFNKNFPFYELKFLGPTIIYRNQAYLKIQLNPQLNALLIYIGLHLREPNNSIDLDNIIQNFWPKSKNPIARLYYLLVQCRAILKLPTHFLSIENVGSKKYLVNKGFYIWTDYNYFQIQLAQAKALERAGEWSFARKEYLKAFQLFRSEPFKKNFDNWSVDMRFRILSQFETEAINFAKSCLEHGNKNDARKILQKVLKIIPDSQEVKGLLDGLMVG
ncbi:MAG: helix-turn-helix domain-containing protein [candidate division WOR-3 bacterium]